MSPAPVEDTHTFNRDGADVRYLHHRGQIPPDPEAL